MAHPAKAVANWFLDRFWTAGRLCTQLQRRLMDAAEGSRSGLARPGNVLKIAANREHWGQAAMFPVGLPTFFLKAYSDPGDLVLDPFLGSGTTLIAAEQTGRVCFGMEILAKYADVCLSRWEQFTGQVAVRCG